MSHLLKEKLETSKKKHHSFQMDDNSFISHQGYSLNEVFKRMEIRENFKPVNFKDLKMKVNDLNLEIKKIKENNALQDRKIINLQFQITSMSQIIKDNELMVED